MLRCRQMNVDDTFYGGMRHMKREVINFNTKWAFTKEATEVPKEMPEKWYWVTLPHSWNEIDGQDGGNDYYRGTCYYAKTVKEERTAGGRLLLSGVKRSKRFRRRLCERQGSGTSRRRIFHLACRHHKKSSQKKRT